MKNLFFTSIISLLLLGCIKNNEEQNTQIESLIANETRTFYKKDFSAWSANFAHNEKVHWVCVEPDAMLRASGWEDLSQFVGGWMKENPEPMDYKKANFQITNQKIEIMGDMAFVNFEYSNQLSAVKKSVESRVLVKEEDQWKILSMTSYPSDIPEGSTKNYYVYKK
jgi:SnoaL-like domain